ncbi:ABC transporter related [Beutenbergia cavernae DSM 12333]|uniref:ABC transporter related n=1 Tax=Beutenbergia cavernae (strain ATCC BAA-8 / DSM 12333 / CCUG 43141 / JCM 11478 / NBRC 16432 / NCIMB 13614 / HKI 0122) TaxID=471853 RepID=C5BX60_BEUC1|nr:ABC transporter ATP-binding protein [Beutenbergia cavernae]ACQ78735.1 ABC transporter related [Beutenbergia cavernae DSM 12333]
MSAADGVVATSSSAPLLRVAGLSVTYRGRRGVHQAVRGVSLDVARGEVVALVGESGSGKTTIGRTILGLLPASAERYGAVELDGADLLRLPDRRRRRVLGARIATIPQDPLAALNPVQRIGPQVAEVLAIHGLASGDAARARALEALRLAGLDDAEARYRQYPHELSGGQRQRVLIAIAIVAGPELIVADEPTSALDVTVQRRILDHLEHLVRETGTSLLLITHDLGVAGDRADRVVVLSDGEVVEQGATGAVLERPEQPYTRALLEATPDRRPPATPPPSAGSSDSPALEVRGLGRTFHVTGRPPVTAADDVSFTIPRGGALGLVGESGSGKTTTARIVLGLLRPDAGEVLVDGRVQDSPAEIRRARRFVQPVFQDPYSSLSPHQSIASSIAEPLRALGGGNRAERRARVAELLDRVHLPASVGRRRPTELSGGQLQRVAIARALAIHPRLVVCDEPVSSLDVSVQARVLDVLAELREQDGLALLFISHDLAVVRAVCEDVAIMRAGRIVEQGRTLDVFASPASPYTAELLAAIPGRRTAAAVA